MYVHEDLCEDSLVVHGIIELELNILVFVA